MSKSPEVAASEQNGLTQIQFILGVASGKGGVGKSTVSAHLARAFADLGFKTGLLDADIYGPSQGLMFGVEQGKRPDSEAGRFIPIEAAGGVKLMSMAFLVTEQTPTVWRGPMASGALQQMLLNTVWGELDVLIVDLPPGTGDIQLTLSQRAKLAGAVVVTTPQDIAVLDARKAIEMFAKVNVPVIGLIENMSFHKCSQCGHEDPVFGVGGAQNLHERYAMPVLARLPLDGQLREACDQGQLLVEPHPIGVQFLQAAKVIHQALVDQQEDEPVLSKVDE